MQIANFIMKKFPKQQRWKQNRCENNTFKVPEALENFMQTGFEGEVCACDVIRHKTYSKEIENTSTFSLSVPIWRYTGSIPTPPRSEK